MVKPVTFEDKLYQKEGSLRIIVTRKKLFLTIRTEITCNRERSLGKLNTHNNIYNSREADESIEKST